MTHGIDNDVFGPKQFPASSRRRHVFPPSHEKGQETFYIHRTDDVSVKKWVNILTNADALVRREEGSSVRINALFVLERGNV